MSSKTGLFFVAAISASVFAGCATSSRTPVYQSGQVGQIITEMKGEIIGVQDVLIKARSTAMGSTGTGATIGSAVASAAILGSPIQAAAAAGRVVGGIAGATVDNQKGEELTILLKDGRTIVIVQERGDIPFAVGDTVRIMTGSSSSIYGGPSSRVVRDDTYVKNSR